MRIKKTYVKGSAQYSENMATKVFKTVLALCSSVAVISINTFLVSSVILEWFELIIGGNEQTVRLESKTTG
jgi:hypothetical protein